MVKQFFTQDKFGYPIKFISQIQKVLNQKHAREHTSIGLCFWRVEVLQSYNQLQLFNVEIRLTLCKYDYVQKHS